MSLTPRLLSVAIIALAGVGCSASAKVTRTTPVASLQSYKVVGIRAKGAYNLSRVLAHHTVAQVSRNCQFTNVELSDHARGKPDLVVDLKIHQTYRGGTGIIQNQNKAVVDVLMVLSDGIDQELLGSAWIRGESASINMMGVSPEEEALGAVAKTVASVLGKSGCRGPRVARVADDPKTTIAKNVNTSGTDPNKDGNQTGDPNKDGNKDSGNKDGNQTGDPNKDGNPSNQTGDPNKDGGNKDGGNKDGGNDDAARRAAAEALNKEGKQMFINANVAGAVEKFVKAAETYPDPRYEYNSCLGYETLKRYAEAAQMCKRVLAKNPGAKLRGKAEERLKIIADLQKKSK